MPSGLATLSSLSRVLRLSPMESFPECFFPGAVHRVSVAVL